MKMQEIKQEVYSLTCTKSTRQLKQERPDLVTGKDLRYKLEWQAIFEKIKQLRSQNLDISLADLETSDKMLKESLFKVGKLAGISEKEIELDWQKIKLDAQFKDIHIEEL